MPQLKIDASLLSDADKQLLVKLRQPVDQGGYDGFSADPLHIQAADRIEQLLAALGTEQTMHAAWRKRAEAAEMQKEGMK